MQELVARLLALRRAMALVGDEAAPVARQQLLDLVLPAGQAAPGGQPTDAYRRLGGGQRAQQRLVAGVPLRTPAMARVVAPAPPDLAVIRVQAGGQRVQVERREPAVGEMSCST
ncbi:MAG: hypothetical protein ACFLMY_18040 [Candidatus Brachytrichaceae bacterium NZ_4S206]